MLLLSSGQQLGSHFHRLRRTSPSTVAQRSQHVVVAEAGWLRRGLLAVPVDATSILVGSAACFAAISLDVSQTHLLLGSADSLCHSWVVQHIPPEVRSSTADILVSDTFITLGLCGWAATSAAILFRQPANSLKALALAWGLYLSAAGAVTKGDPPLVWSLKELFHRTRPSTLHSTFSFPSGHTTAATFLIGGLLFTLLPVALAGKADSAPADADELQKPELPQLGSTALAIWVTAMVTTACGRILADAHWLSDTMAGAALGTLLVALLSRVSRPDGKPL